MRELVLVVFFAIAALAALSACTTQKTERLLLGSLVLSMGFACGAGVMGSGFYGFLFLSAFLVTDILVYLFSRTQELAPSSTPKNTRVERLYRAFFLSLSLGVVLVAGFVLFSVELDQSIFQVEHSGTAFGVLEGRSWEQDWLVLSVPLLTILSFVVGGFFLVRKGGVK